MKRETRAAAAVLGAAAGTAFMSGREVVLFFSQLGWASWLAVGTAAAGFGGLCGGLCRLARRTGGSSVPGVLTRMLGPGVGRAVGIVHGLLSLLVACVMLTTCGHLAALTLPIRNAFWMGMLAALSCALALNLLCLRGTSMVAGTALLIAATFFAGLLLDGREIVYYRSYEVVPNLKGSLPMAMALGLLHAALNACAAAGAVVWTAGDVERPTALAWRCAAGMLAMLALANGAILRGGERLFVQALPFVLLAARWGNFGFLAAVGFMAVCAVVALAAALRTLLGRGRSCVKL